MDQLEVNGWGEPRYLEVNGHDDSKQFLIVEGWTTKDTSIGKTRNALIEYYWFDEPPVLIQYLVKLATLQLVGENPDRLYRFINYG